MTIDEEGLHKIKGRNETDHNTITVSLEIESIEKPKVKKTTNWNLRASSTKWEEYKNQFKRRHRLTQSILANRGLTFNQKYKRVSDVIQNAARKTIGKTTIKLGAPFKPSKEVRKLRKKKRELKKKIKKEADKEVRKGLITEYKAIEDSINDQIRKEKKEQTKKKLDRILQDTTQDSFWHLKKQLTRDPTTEAMVVKDKNGIRQYSPHAIKESTATHYETLYKKKPTKSHPYHQQLETEIKEFEENRDYESLRINETPTVEEITEIINNKKNGKSMTDIKNEMLKRPGDAMIPIIAPLIQTSFNDEQAASDWNTGHITSVHKGKGDREDLSNYRPITTSSSIGTIMDQLIDRRIESVVRFTQAQGGGRRGASTCDHLFLTRAIIEISIKEKKPTFLTFYDVQKAYDNIENDHMLAVLWKSGFRGKSWRILRNLTKELKATAKKQIWHD